MSLPSELEQLKNSGQAPSFITEEALQMLKGGYLQPGETPLGAYNRVANGVAKALGMPNLSKSFFNLIWNNWLCPSTPVLANIATDNLPIACFSSQPADDTYDIMRHVQENVMLTKYGGGTGSSFDNLRARGSAISKGGLSDGIVPFLKILEASIDGTRQGSSRRGSIASYLNIKHGDIEEFIDIRKPTGDISRRCLTKSFHNAVTIDDEIMHEIKTKNGKYRELYNKIMTERVENGEPYLLFLGNSNKNCPENYKGRITQSNLCNEVSLPTTPEETFVCCLSSLNLAKYDQWKDYVDPISGLTVVELGVFFLDGVLSEFIGKAENMKGFENSVRFAKNHRALGLGVLGYHTYLQLQNLAFESFGAMQVNNAIFKKIREEADRATLKLGKMFGECKETLGTGRRNTVTMAIAPTLSNSVLSGGISQGIEPITANLFVQKGAKGTFIKKNPTLESLLKSLNKDTSEIWDQINRDSGSVVNLKFLSDEEKAIFATAREINQFALVRQASQRQQYIDQSQSLNLFFSLPKTASDSLKVSKYINKVHLEAYELGVKGLYYLKTGSPIKGVSIIKDSEDCASCQG